VEWWRCGTWQKRALRGRDAWWLHLESGLASYRSPERRVELQQFQIGCRIARASGRRYKSVSPPWSRCSVVVPHVQPSLVLRFCKFLTNAPIWIQRGLQLFELGWILPRDHRGVVVADFGLTRLARTHPQFVPPTRCPIDVPVCWGRTISRSHMFRLIMICYGAFSRDCGGIAWRCFATLSCLDMEILNAVALRMVFVHASFAVEG
jgi:hypothetical protein